MAAVLLTEYLASAGRRAFVWGSFDCLLYIADWVARSTGIDPAPDLRGIYDSERGARRLIKARGGMVTLVGNGLARSGLVPCDDVTAGDVGLVRVAMFEQRGRVVFGPTGAICVSPSMWAHKSAHGAGLVVQNFPLIKAWGRRG